MALVVIYYSDGSRLSAHVQEDTPELGAVIMALQKGGDEIKAIDPEGHITYD